MSQNNYKLRKGSLHWDFDQSRNKIQFFGGGFANGKTTALVIKALKKVNTLTGEEMQHYVVPNIESISKTSFLNNYIMAFMDSGVFNYPVNKMYKRNIRKYV